MRIRHTVTALTFALATAGIAQAAPVAVVNGTAIQQNELDSAVSAIVRSGGGRIKDTPYGQLTVQVIGSAADVGRVEAAFAQQSIHCEVLGS